MSKEKYEESSPGQPTPGANDPSKAIDTPGEVEKSNDEKIDQDFPGYPHYPAKDDILNPKNNNGKVDVDINNLSRANNTDPLHIKSIEGSVPVDDAFEHVNPMDDDSDLGIQPGTDADVTAEDLIMLGPRDDDMDMGEDEELRRRGWEPKNPADLDVPAVDLNEGDAALGQVDEENNYYSLGGDRENLEENRNVIPGSD